jgi:signal transduction histidine kinase/DNA-binding response OmpR family regulator
MKKLLILCFLLVVQPSVLYSQFKTDSLQYALKHALADSVKIGLLHQLFLEYQKDSVQTAEATILKAIAISVKLKNNHSLVRGYNLYADFLRIQSREDTALIVNSKSIKLADEIGYTQGQSDAILSMAGIFWQKGNFNKAREFAERNIALSKKLKDTARLGRSYNVLAAIHSQLGEYTTAMTYYTESSKMFYALGHTRSYAMTLGNIGWIQRSLENYTSAVTYFSKADSIYIELNNPSGRSFTAYNLAVTYKDMGQLDKALEYNKRGLQGYQQLGIKKRVSYCYFNLAEIYGLKKEYEVALENYLKSLELSLAVDDSVQIGYSKMAVGRSMLELGQRDEALQHIKDAGEVAKRMELDILAMDVHKELFAIYEDKGNLGEALVHLKKYSLVRDSLYTKEKRELGTEIEAKYQNEQKVKEIALLAKDNDLQNLKLNKRINERNGIIAFALLMIVLAGLLYNQYRIKQNANRKLQQLNRLKSNFFANISHEFRTPLTLIKGPIERLEQNPEEQLSMENIKMIRRNTNRVLKLVNQLLDLSKIDSGNLKLVPTEGDVYKCLRAVASSFNSYAAQHHHDYKVSIPSTVFWTSFDRDKLEKIGFNLLSNAFKFSEAKSVITFQAMHQGHYLLIEVSDTGKGISKEQLPFVFDRFYQAEIDTDRYNEGTGLGLSLTKNLVELMGGTITISSKPQQGSTFKIHLPLQQIKTTSLSSSKMVYTKKDPLLSVLPGTSAVADHRKLPVVLLVEDNVEMRGYIRETLIHSFKIREANNGASGIKSALKNSPDLVITDLMMPVMDGLEFCKKLKTNIVTSHIPVIMLTAKAGLENKLEGLETGADDYLTKPFNTQELLVRSRNLIEQRRKLRSRYLNSASQMNPAEIAVTSIDQKFLEKMLSLLEEHYKEPDYGVPQLQGALAMSRAQFHRKVRALTNETPGAILRHFRLKRAAQLLAQKADSVTQIAYCVGFNNLSYFTKCFKEFYGVTPSDYSLELHTA